MSISKRVSSLTPDNGLSLAESNQLLTVHKEILEVVITGKDFQFALESLCRSAEGILPKALASIILFNKDNESLSVRAAPNIPEQAIEELDGLVPGEQSGSCAAAVYSGKAQYVYDTRSDPIWSNVRSFARTYNINACWSMPIVDKDKHVIGSFALSSFENRVPNAFQENLMQTAAFLAGLILLREREESELLSAAYCDPLTNLPNRRLLTMRLKQAIAKANRNQSSIAIFFIDLDDFKRVNDEIGHDAGDNVLCSIADVLKSCIRQEDTLARLGGDEFVLLVEGLKQKEELRLIAQKMLKAVQQTLVISGHEFSVSASIGISHYPQGFVSDIGQVLLKRADQAMYKAKKSDKEGKEKVHFYGE